MGKYGRCGSIIRDASAGTLIVPSPNGQMPATARNSVDLPDPDGPVRSVRSPARRLKPSAETSGLPLGRLTRSCRRLISLVAVFVMPIEPGSVGRAAALAIAL